MKKVLLSLCLVMLAFVFSSCQCFFYWLMTGEDLCGGHLSQSIVSAVFEDLPVADTNTKNEHGAPIRQGIVGLATSSEPGGGSDEENNEENGSSFKDIITRPSFTLGPSLSWLGGDKQEGEKFPAKSGFQLGATWQVPLTGGLNLEPGLLYANRGVGYKTEESGYYEPGVPGPSYGYSYGQKKKLHYMELPVFVSGQVSNGLSVFGGPQVGFLMGAKVINESNGKKTSTEKGTKGLKKVDVGLAAGVRYQIPNSFLSVSMGYYHGLSNLSAGAEYSGYGYDEPKYFTRAARLGVQYNFPAARRHANSGSVKKNAVKSWITK